MTKTHLKHSQEGAFTGKSGQHPPCTVLPFEGSQERAPRTVNRKVPPMRRPNRERRAREYLTEKEVSALMEAARRSGRHGQRDATLILLS